MIINILSQFFNIILTMIDIDLEGIDRKYSDILEEVSEFRNSLEDKC